MRIFKTPASFITLIVMLMSSIQIYAKEHATTITGTVCLSNQYILISIQNNSHHVVFIKDFWQSFSKGRFIKNPPSSEKKPLDFPATNLIAEDVFSRGRHWINLMGERKDEYPAVDNVVHLRLSLSELLEKSLLSAREGDRVEMDIIYAVAGDKIPIRQDWKQSKLSLKFKNHTRVSPVDGK